MNFDEKQKSEKYEVSPLELMFDLVIAFAISELNSYLGENPNLYGILETLILMIVIYNVWVYTSFEATLIHVGKTRTQWMMLFVMLLGIFMTAGIPDAFEKHPLTFVIPFLISQVGHGIFTIFSDIDRELQKHYIIMMGWILLTIPLWTIGVFATSQDRIVWWGIAAFIDLFGTWFAHPVPGRVLVTDHVEFDADHMLERSRLFLIIAIGETIFSLARSLSEAPMSSITIVVVGISFISIISLWALYFWGSDHIVVRSIEETRNPILTARLTMNGLIIAVAGLIFFAVGIKMMMADPFANSDLIIRFFLFGGPILYLLPQGWYLWYVTRKIPYIRLSGILILILSFFFTIKISNWVSLFILAMVLVGLSFFIICQVKKTE